jgi:hypothetical protein
MQMIVVHVPPKLFRQGLVALVRVEDGGQDVLLSAHLVHRAAVRFGIESCSPVM